MLKLTRQNIGYYKGLMRTEKPIGWLLLLWPTLWALWISAEGLPDIWILLVFCAGVFLMRSAGCVINDYADRNFDGHVARTQKRPLAAGKVTPTEALQLFGLLIVLSFLLVISLGLQTTLWSIGALLLASIYPFMKRYTHLPQVVLGAAFGWSIPMAFIAVQQQTTWLTWALYLANLLWTVAYDTYYAMVDREDDVKIGIKSTAVLFGKYDLLIIVLLQLITLGIFGVIGIQQGYNTLFWSSLAVVAGLFARQLWSSRQRQPEACFKAFLNNNWVGLILFIGIATQYL